MTRHFSCAICDLVPLPDGVDPLTYMREHSTKHERSTLLGVPEGETGVRLPEGNP